MKTPSYLFEGYRYSLESGRENGRTLWRYRINATDDGRLLVLSQYRQRRSDATKAAKRVIAIFNEVPDLGPQSARRETARRSA